MEFVNLYGCTTAEKLIKLTEAVNGLHSIVNELGFFVYDGAYNKDDPNFQYNAELLHTPTVTTEVLNRPVYFSENTTIAVITTYGNNLFTVRNAHNITGVQGIQGERGERGEKGERGEQGIQGEKGDTGAQGAKGFTGTGVANITNGNPYVSGEYTVTPVDYEMSDGTEIPLSVYAKNGADGGVTVDDALSTESVNPVQNKVVTAAINNAKPIIDSQLSLSSENPVQNKVVTEAINNAKPIIDSQLSLSSENPVQNKVVTEAINAAASTPKLYRHNITCILRIGAFSYNNVMFDVVDTTDTEYTSDTFRDKYVGNALIHATYPGTITQPGANRSATLKSFTITGSNMIIHCDECANSSSTYNDVITATFTTPYKLEEFNDYILEL